MASPSCHPQTHLQHQLQRLQGVLVRVHFRILHLGVLVGRDGEREPRSGLPALEACSGVLVGDLGIWGAQVRGVWRHPKKVTFLRSGTSPTPFLGFPPAPARNKQFLELPPGGARIPGIRVRAIPPGRSPSPVCVWMSAWVGCLGVCRAGGPPKPRMGVEPQH